MGPKDLWKFTCTAFCSHLFTSSAQLFSLWHTEPMFFFKLVKPLSFETYRANGYVLFYRLCSTFSNVTYWTYGYIGTLLFLLLLVFVYLFSLGPKDTWKSICTSSCSKSHQFLWPTLFTVTYRTYVSLPFVVKTSFFWDLQGLVYDANRVLLHFLQITLHLFWIWPTGPMDILPLSYYCSFWVFSSSSFQ